MRLHLAVLNSKRSVSKRGSKNPSFGKVPSLETRRKISEALQGKQRITKGKKWEEIYGQEEADKKRETVIRLMRGRVVSELTKKRFLETVSAQFRSGCRSHFLGKHHSLSARKKLSKAKLKRFCIRGHDTREVGRNSNFQCRSCAAIDAHSRRGFLKSGKRDLKSIKAVYHRANELRRWFDVVVDHIIPRAAGGLHTASNLQIIYRKENAIKQDKLDFKPTVIFR